MLGHPLLDELPKRVSLLQKLANLGVRGHICHVIIEHVPLPATGLKIACERRNPGPHRELYCFKRREVVPLPHDPIAGTGDRHLGQLQDSVVSRGKLAVRREAGHFRIVQITLDDGAKPVEFVVACRMALHPVGCE